MSSPFTNDQLSKVARQRARDVSKPGDKPRDPDAADWAWMEAQLTPIGALRNSDRKYLQREFRALLWERELL